MGINKPLRKSYKEYRRGVRGKKTALSFLRVFMSEIIFRTTKLEGEPVTRKMTQSVCG